MGDLVQHASTWKEKEGAHHFPLKDAFDFLTLKKSDNVMLLTH